MEGVGTKSKRTCIGSAIYGVGNKHTAFSSLFLFPLSHLCYYLFFPFVCLLALCCVGEEDDGQHHPAPQGWAHVRARALCGLVCVRSVPDCQQHR